MDKRPRCQCSGLEIKQITTSALKIAGPSRLCSLVALCCALLASPFAVAQPNPSTYSTIDSASLYSSSFSICAHSLFTIPLVDSAEYYGLGGTLGLGIEHGFSGNPQFFLSGAVDYAFIPVKDGASYLSLLNILVGGGTYFWLTPRLGIKLAGMAGYYRGFLSDAGGSSGQLAVQGGAQIGYKLIPALDLSVGANFRYDLGTFQGLAISASTSYYLQGTEGRRRAIQQAERRGRVELLEAKTPEQGRGLDLVEIEFYEIFPVFHKFYDDHPVGKAVLVNLESEPITDIQFSFFIKQYMDSPKESPVPSQLDAGGCEPVEIMSLLTDTVLEVTEATKVAAELNLEYRMNGELYRDTRIFTVRLLDRNAMSWDDDRKAAAFVTAKDPAILTLSKMVAGVVREQGPAAVNLNFRTAMGMFAAMELHGLSYVVDPKTPFVEFSKDKSLVDYLQFPRQTMEYGAGDCDDLSILFAALLESVGVETAFVTVPGHIFLAFSTGLSAEEAATAFRSTDELILESGKAWVPVETTIREGGFMKAWAEGARQWRQACSRDTARLFPVHEAWRRYEPVGLTGTNRIVDLPEKAAISNSYQQEMRRYVEREISPQITQLEGSLHQQEGDPAVHNRLGILYARYGSYDLAEREFRAAVQQREYLPALINLGNLFLLQEQAERARGFLERAIAKQERNPKALLALSRVYHEMEEYELAAALHRQLAEIDRPLAERYSFLGGTIRTDGRAAAADTVREEIFWTE